MKWRRRERRGVCHTCKSSSTQEVISGSYIVRYIQSCQSLKERGEAEMKSSRNRKETKRAVLFLWLAELRVKHLPTWTVPEEKGARATVTKTKRLFVT